MKARWLALGLVLMLSVSWAKTDYHHIQLGNGLKVYVIEDHRAPVVFNSLWYRVGSADEVDGYTGLSHMLEHMLFRGTDTIADGEFARRVHDEGGQLNAMTSQDFTMYYNYVPKEKLPMVLRLEADRMRHLVLNKKLVAREKKVVQEERRMRILDKPASMLSMRFNAAAFTNNPYHHPVIGWGGDIAAYTLKDVANWYHQWYHPNNASLVIVGDVDSKAVFHMVRKYFEAIPRAKLPVRKARKEIEPLGLKRLLVQYPSKVPVLKMGYLVPGLVQADHNWQAYALEVLAGVLDSTASSRLPKLLVREQELASSINVSYSTMRRYQTMFAITAVPAHGHSMGELEQAIERQIKRLQQERVSRSELERAKAQVVAHAIYQRDSPQQRAFNIGIPVMAGLPWNIDQRWVQAIERVTSKQVRWAARHYLQPSRLTVAYLEPTAREKSNRR